MLMKHIDSLPIVIAGMEIQSIKHDSGAFWRINNKEKTFNICVKKSIAKKLNPDDTIEFVYIPSEDLKREKAVLFLKIKQFRMDEILIGKNTYWHKYYIDKWPFTR